MRDLLDREVDRYRERTDDVAERFGSHGDGTCGVFRIPSPVDKAPMLIIASSGGGWDHVSVSRRNRCPNWPEMDFVKRLFFKPDEVAIQLHVAAADHISHHDHCLHLWRCQDRDFPLPPHEFVA